jgi:hypothetical protein
MRISNFSLEYNNQKEETPSLIQKETTELIILTAIYAYI